MFERDKTIDVLKGIGILLVILGHCISGLDEPVNRIILSFHMPCFFFASGLLAKNRKGYFKYIIGKCKKIIPAQLLLGLLRSGYDLFFVILIAKKANFSSVDWISYFTQWFLIVMLYVYIFEPIIYKIILDERNIFKVILFVVLFVVAYYSSSIKNSVSSLEKLPTALLFFSFGCLINVKRWKSIILNFMKKYVVFTIPVFIVFTRLNTPVAMYMNDYGNYFLFFVTSMMGIAIIYYFADCLQDNKTLQLFGKNSLIVFITHISVVYLSQHFLDLFLPNTLSSKEYPCYFIIFLMVVIFESLLLVVLNVTKYNIKIKETV